MQTQMGCPDCGTAILLDTRLLLSGRSFMCPQCHLSVALAGGSRRQVQTAVQGFDRLAAMKDSVGKRASERLTKKRN
ncbi:hypothetical protein A167_01615 [Alcanivorax sp. S71-1-4]|uniref:hypothetical protein n=1 Tax=Alcanivorax sp. S71-1-4 TaxID=1177159 RepID=UPI00135BC32C|nr:hypothetical protein [Alcanivorax sp. S71-1-4]KAF0809544.1 hypothetical protein A167_01615 [Alcanivorax sp. S71-1-4]